MVSLRFRASNFGPRLYSVFRVCGGVLGVLTTRIDDISRCGERDVMDLARRYSERRFGVVKAQGKDFASTGAE